MKLILILIALTSTTIAAAQGKFFGGSGDGFATATISNIVLPSTGLALTGIVCGEDICLNWSTVQESNTSHFSIERMNNTAAFAAIGRVEAAGTSNGGRNYSFTDKWPLNGMNYYRLAQTDRDGRVNYSPTIQVEQKQKKLIGQVTNPAGNQLSIRLLQTLMPFTLSVFDMQGKLLKRSVHSGLHITEDISTLADGLYLFTIEAKGRKEQRTFVKLR
jgi:hypothetical protein